MWIIANEDDLFEGKRFWLRPGKAHVIGRVIPPNGEEGAFTIVDKTVSRQHIRVVVDTVGTSASTNTHSRSKITIEDLNTKIGTTVNGEQIRGRKFELTTGENLVTVGRYKSRFILTWVPVTFSFSFTKKELASGTLTAIYERLGPLDIKALNHYEPGVTSHLIISKRNTAKGLQALIDGRYIVQYDSYLRAVMAAATRSDPEAKSALEEDWDGSFPDPLQYLPPRGEEPTERGEDTYAPNPSRRNMFEGYSFIFCHKNQFNTLLAPITEGGGKALLYEVLFNETKMDDFIRYVKSMAGETGLGSFDDGSEGKGVVVVRYNPSKGDEEEIKFHNDFNRDVSLHLDHRLIEQNEFLDAILGVDASVLRRPLEMEASGIVPPPPTANTIVTSQPATAPSVIPPLESQRKWSRFRKAAAPKFKGFDSDDDDVPMVMDSVPESVAVDNNRLTEPQSQGLFMTQDPNWDVNEELPDAPATATRSGRKRVPPPVDYDDDEEVQESIMARLAPAATALKKKKLAEDSARRQKGEVFSPPAPPLTEPAMKTIKESLTSKKRKATPEPTQPVKKVKKETKETIYAKAARLRIERAEELARVNRDLEDQDVSGINPEHIRKLTVVETMETRQTEAPSRAARADESDRWDDAWNGRKNFKKFRRRGGEEVIRNSRVIVPLEFYKTKEYGVGEEYWLETESARRKKGKGKDTQDVSQVSQAKTKSQAKTQREPGLVNDPFAIPSSKSDSDDPQPAAKTRATRTTASQGSAATKKRAATTTLTRPAPAKKSRITVAEVEDSDDEDSDDDGKFRFGRRR